MQQTYINPFVTIQNYGSDTLIAVTSDSDKFIKIYDPCHPLYGINEKKEIVQKLPLLSEKDFNYLLDRNFISLKPFDQNAMLDKIYQHKDSDKEFSITIFPTLNCNNACVYCYQKHQDQPRMSSSDYEAVYNLVLDKINQGVTRISVGLMGGEPTLENRLVLPFIERCKKICNDSGVEFSCSMTTNGRIMDVEKYLDSGIRFFQITLDGPSEIHDRLRPGIKGEKTFKTILTGLINLRNNGGENFHCSVRINHTKESIKDNILNKYLSLLSENFKQDQRFEIFHRIASDLGGDIDKSVLISEKECKTILETVNNKTRSYGLFTRTDMYQPNSRVCYAAQKNAVAVLPGLKLIKCTVAIEEKNNHIGMLSSKGIPKFNNNLHLWISDKVRDSKCISCEFAPICQSRSCPLERIRKGKNPCPDIKSDKSFLIRKMQHDRIAVHKTW